MFGGSIVTLRSGERALEAVVADGDARREAYRQQATLFIN